MKRIIYFIMILAAVFCFTAAAVAQDVEPPSTDAAGLNLEALEAYLNEKIIPAAIMVITAICTIMLAIMPILSRVKKASEKFSAAEDGIKKNVDDTNKRQKEIYAFVEEVNGRMTRISETLDKEEKTMERLEQIEEKLEEMMRVGFCNTPSLVRNGTAGTIYSMAEDTKKALEDVRAQRDVEENNGASGTPVPTEEMKTEKDGEREETDNAQEA